ncbi:hypothetical protein [Streptomyces werraensis]|uniref:hypothetical protein n=1 Tax=Streptomyces werraensis TaxID=68284 RepID=UPI0038253F7F
MAGLINAAVQWVFDWNAYRRMKWERRRELARRRASERWWGRYDSSPLAQSIQDQERRAKERREAERQSHFERVMEEKFGGTVFKLADPEPGEEVSA